MTFRPVRLPGPLTLVPGDSLAGRTRALALDHPHLRPMADPGRLVQALNDMPDGVAATFDEPKRAGGDPSLVLYLPSCTVRLFLTPKYRDAYSIASVNPIRMRDHQRLARGCLLVRPALWRLAFDVHAIPRPSDSHWGPLTAEWRLLGDRLAAVRGVPELTPGQAAFLDTLDRTIEATERISEDAPDSGRLYPYRDVASTGERRHGTRSVYVFRMVGAARPEERAFVQVHGEPGLRGQVTRVDRDAVTVRFEKAVAWARFGDARQGHLEATPSRVVYAKQTETVALLRSRQAHNTTLLPAIVEGRVRRIPPARARPAEDLDLGGQLEAFEKGTATEDVLVVLGPPGTGKTRVISQLALAAAAQGERVLVTSKTHRAVDNVLARLPAHLEVVRVGHEGSVTAEGRPYLLERRVAELRGRVADAAARAEDGYGGLDAARGWTAELDARVRELDAARDGQARAGERLDAVRRAVGGPAQARVDALTAERDAHRRALDRHLRCAERQGRRVQQARSWARRPVLGVLFGRFAAFLDARRAAGEEQGRACHQAWSAACGALAAAARDLDAATRADPSVRAAADAAEAAAFRLDGCRAAARKAALEASAAVAAVALPPSLDDTGPGPGAGTGPDAGLARLLQWLHRTLPLLEARARLLAEWRREVAGAAEQLYPELVRYADVIAATCIGAASRPELSGVDFDLAIVDEAGQIGVADALVPLARARRGVLVGDPQQLPPFLDSDVEAWGRTAGDDAVRELLGVSALERLAARLPRDHVVRLTRQRRMPRAIADFVSAAFYDGVLVTDVEREHRDALFARPLALVDTARLPGGGRFERPGQARERWGRAGYVNQAEARLLYELALHYHRTGGDWAVIVPYRAQATKITAALARRIGADAAELHVGTVDSFQGGERDVVLYGFTRSNTDGRVGFLKELRRANVAFTRARRQLVLVGDVTTLTTARDVPFRAMAGALRDHAAAHGDVRQYQEVLDQVTKLNRGGRA
ncbi:ATP-binding protein [Actinomadura graeca]|uniref:ATP-binding protein n=1 Tax=Actinomadura graeca TaxID=2750812 RepID=A0ABX8QNF6_9ACTN|nr:AAA domain-containing protein [Actinomadura graeca]QXJ20316.1 ATP-binding protein [Actinomadura graeca]